MSSKKSLFVGCSFTANSGFTIENQSKFHWPHLFCQNTGYVAINRAIGGMSNKEIFLRTVESVTADQYDLVIVMWSEVDRHWGYCSDKNVDDFTMLNYGVPNGFQADADYTVEYAKLHYTWFNNRYINIKHWLLYCLSLEHLLKNLNIPYVFIRGFNNDVDRLFAVEYQDGFTNIDILKPMLDFDNRPDDYILKKIEELKQLVLLQDQTRWLNLFGTAFRDIGLDVADDLRHPGPKTNKKLAENLIKFYKGLNEQSI